MTASAPQLNEQIERRLEILERERVVDRIWDRDPSVWGGSAATPELADRLGWLTAMDWTEQHLDTVDALVDRARGEFDAVLLLGMGGASLAAEVLARSFGQQEGFPSFHILDSPHPVAVSEIGERTAPERTLYIVASKSGTTIETTRLFEYFWQRSGKNGSQFIAISDPGTALARLAAERGFRAAFENPPDIGGRYSALSMFGMVPAGLMGLDVRRLLSAARDIATACRQAPNANPGVALGILMAEGAVDGRDKLTLCMDPIVRTFGLWMEQLVAESTGKGGKGIVPVADEELSTPPRVTDDRLFVALNLAGTRDSATTVVLRTLEERGHPIYQIQIADRYALGAEFFRWEFATALTGAIIGVNPFDQPNVAEAKVRTTRLLAEAAGGRETRARPATRAEIHQVLHGVEPGHYLAILGYLRPSSSHDRRLVAVQTTLRERLGAVVTIGYGPRYLHSTGQLHKAGPPTGHFIQVIDPTVPKLPLPKAGQSLAALTWAQAAGDFEALRGRGRPVVQVMGLDTLEAAIR